MVSYEDKGKHLKDMIVWEVTNRGEGSFTLEPEESKDLYALTEAYKIREGSDNADIKFPGGIATYTDQREDPQFPEKMRWVVLIDDFKAMELRRREGPMHVREGTLAYVIESGPTEKVVYANGSELEECDEED